MPRSGYDTRYQLHAQHKVAFKRFSFCAIKILFERALDVWTPAHRAVSRFLSVYVSGSPPRALDARLSRRVWRGARAGLAVLSATSGFRHFILPPMRAAQLTVFYKRASGRPANTH